MTKALAFDDKRAFNVRRILLMARYLVTGGTGFIGKALADVIRAEGHEVIIATRGRHKVSDSDWVEYDLKDRATIANIIETKPDGIYHLAWSTTPSTAEADAASDIEANLAGTVALFQELLSRCVDVPVLFLSSGGTVYGVAEQLPIPESHALRPIGAYGMAKASSERYASLFRQQGLDVRIARLANPFGSMQSSAKLQGAASIFARKIARSEPITIWGDGNAVRDYIRVEDAALALTKIMQLDVETFKSSVVFNVGSGEGLSLNELIDIIATAAEMRPEVSYEPRRSFDIPANTLDITKITSTTGWCPRQSTQNAIREMASTFKNLAFEP
jgi:UDP-glucose 4-epimerase